MIPEKDITAAVPDVSDAFVAPPMLVDSGQRRRAMIEIFVMLCIGVLPFLVNSIHGILQPSTGTDEISALLYACIDAARGWLIVVPVLWIMWQSGLRPRQCGFVPWSWLCDGALVVAVLASSWATFSLVGWAVRMVDSVTPGFLDLLYALTPASAYEWEQIRFTGPAAMFAMAISLVAHAAIEELVCRAYLITRLEQLGWHKGWAVVCSAAVFASYHCYQGAVGTIDVFMFGVLMGGLYVWTRRVAPLIVGHALWNFMMFFVYPWSGQ